MKSDCLINGRVRMSVNEVDFLAAPLLALTHAQRERKSTQTTTLLHHPYLHQPKPYPSSYEPGVHHNGSPYPTPSTLMYARATKHFKRRGFPTDPTNSRHENFGL